MSADDLSMLSLGGFEHSVEDDALSNQQEALGEDEMPDGDGDGESAALAEYDIKLNELRDIVCTCAACALTSEESCPPNRIQKNALFFLPSSTLFISSGFYFSIVQSDSQTRLLIPFRDLGFFCFSPNSSLQDSVEAFSTEL